MFKKAHVILPVIAVAGLIAAIPGSSIADQNPLGRCPDGYQPTLFTAAPDEDRNGNGVICVRSYPNGVKDKDDPNGKPYRCNNLNPAQVIMCQESTLEEANALIQDDIIDE